MIQDIFPYQYKNEYTPGQPGESSTIMFYDGRKLLVKRERDNIIFPSYREIRKCEEEAFPQIEYIYLFSIDSQDFYLADRPKNHSYNLPGENPLHESLQGYGWEDIQICRHASIGILL